MRRSGELIPEYNDFSGYLVVGSIETRPHPWELSDEEASRIRKEDRRKRARRAPIGFQLPTKD